MQANKAASSYLTQEKETGRELKAYPQKSIPGIRFTNIRHHLLSTSYKEIAKLYNSITLMYNRKYPRMPDLEIDLYLGQVN